MRVLYACLKVFDSFDFCTFYPSRSGQNICKPDSSVLTSKHGVLRDDDITGQSIKDGNGYGNKLDCGVRLRAPRGGKVNFHLTQMNLEGDGNGICDPHSKHYIGHSCDGNGGDFLEIYDGRNKHAKLLAKLNGQPLDAVLKQDTFTSTGRNLFVRFVTDGGNCERAALAHQPSPGILLTQQTTCLHRWTHGHYGRPWVLCRVADP